MIHVIHHVTTFTVVIMALINFRIIIDAAQIDVIDEISQNHTISSNEIIQYETSKNQTEKYPHDMLEKPSKFDQDFGKMHMTDDRQLLRKEKENCTAESRGDSVREKIANFLGFVSRVGVYNITKTVQIVRNDNVVDSDFEKRDDDFPLSEKVKRFAKNHALQIKLPNYLIASETARTFFGTVFQGKSSFLTGFGLGFLAFGLKKLLLPLILGVQIIKSILIALFLPSIIGTIGKIVGKGVSSFAQSSQSVTAQPAENFDFKDNQELYNDDYMTNQPLGTLPASAMYDETMLQKSPEIASRYGFGDHRFPHVNKFSDRYYMRYADAHGGVAKKQDFKIFHEIPTSSLLLTNYDPFYSPLLSRLDAVFSRLGHMTEGCREYAVCAMYRSPARFAPYSNLVSAQLSRELNELRKPSSDNPDVLRFFRYMKSAKDGQDGIGCEDVYRDCAMAREDQSLRQNQAMLATYQDIDKLVHARKL